MKSHFFYGISFVVIAGYFLLVGPTSIAPTMPLYDYQEECLNEGCNREETEELWESYDEECFGEGCSTEEIVELGGNTNASVRMLDEFARRGWRIDTQHYSWLGLADCSAPLKTRCTGVVLWCNDQCVYSNGDTSGWYVCGGCFGFSW